VSRCQAGREAFVRLQEPAALSLDAGGLKLAQACFGVYPAGRLCLESEWRAGAERTLFAALDDVSPNFALNLLGSDLAVTQRLSGLVDWRQQPGRPAQARVRLDVSAGAVVLDDDEPLFETGPGLIGFELADGRLLEGNLDIPLAGGGGIDTDFSVPDFSLGLDSLVQGRLRIELDDIGPVLRLLPPVEGSSGPVTADLRLSGTLAGPKLSGNASLVQGRISHFASGLLLKDLQVAGAVNETERIELTGTFRAGEGQGSLRAVVNFADLMQPELLLELRGEQLTLINVPDLTVVANPDVQLTLRPGVLDVDGRIVVPSARLSPKFLPTASVAESADVVIVAGQDRSRHAGSRRERRSGQLGSNWGRTCCSAQRATAVTGTTMFRWAGGRPCLQAVAASA
jgi:translocation and assembly module TamB